MYERLRISDTLHKKPCRIGPGLCGTSENFILSTSVHSVGDVRRKLACETYELG
jgi:hypothetical protein